MDGLVTTNSGKYIIYRLIFSIFVPIMTLKVKTDMPDENQQPITQTSQPDSLDIAPQVIQPTNSNMVTPYSSSPEHQPVASSLLLNQQTS